jgi:ligand-binding sensor domain-containing protein
MTRAWALVALAACGPAAGEPLALGDIAGAADHAHAIAVPAREAPRRSVGTRVLTNTLDVEALALDGDVLWVATRGGVERYAGEGFRDRRVYTTLDGLAENHAWAIAAAGGAVEARTQAARCRLVRDRFECVPAAALATPEPALAATYQGARVTAREGGFVGTAGAGVWLDGERPRRLTPAGQICSNHVTAIAEWQGRVWFGTFDDGLCVTSDFQTFAAVDAPLRMINDLAVTPRGLYVADAAGLFHTRDGRTFDEVDAVTAGGVNGLAFDGKSLWATTPGALWRLRVAGGPRTRAYWRPGGTRSLQGVAVGPGGTVWLASEDRGAIKKTKQGFDVFDRAAGAPSSWALAIAVDDDDTAWVGTLRDGLLRIDRRGRMQTVADLPDAWLLDVRAAAGRIFVGTQGGAAFVDPSGAVARVAHVPHPNVHAMHDGRGGLWIATEGGTLLVGG